MSDPIALINGVLTGLQAASATVKLIQEASGKTADAEGRNRVADLVGSMADLKLMVADLKVSVLAKDEQIRELQDMLQVEGQMSFEKNVYYRSVDGEKDGPFCPRCWDSDKKLVRLYVDPDNDHRRCNTCHAAFGFPDGRGQF